MTNNDSLFPLFNGMVKGNLNYIYRGVFTQSITDNILLFAESKLDEVSENNKIKKRVFTIMVEGLQNITRHQETNSFEGMSEEGVFFMQDVENHYYITTGNPIYNDSIPKLTEQLNNINSLNPEELKKYYKEVLRNNIISNKGGAGLGLIEIARKSGNKLIYDFVKLDDTYSYFYLTTEIQRKNLDEPVVKQVDFLEDVKVFHKEIIDKDILLIFNGKFDQESLLNLLSLINNYISDDQYSLKKKFVTVMVELLQNIVLHGAAIDDSNAKLGVFSINKCKSSYCLHTGNYVTKTEVDALVDNIELINSLSEQEEKAMFEKKLFNFEDDDRVTGAGLGLLFLKQKSKQKLNYKITDYNEEYSFFEIRVCIQ